MPADFAPWPTVFGYLRDWQASGATERMHGQLRDACRIAAGRTPGPTAAIIDSRYPVCGVGYLRVIDGGAV